MDDGSSPQVHYLLWSGWTRQRIVWWRVGGSHGNSNKMPLIAVVIVGCCAVTYNTFLFSSLPLRTVLARGALAKKGTNCWSDSELWLVKELLRTTWPMMQDTIWSMVA